MRHGFYYHYNVASLSLIKSCFRYSCIFALECIHSLKLPGENTGNWKPQHWLRLENVPVLIACSQRIATFLTVVTNCSCFIFCSRKQSGLF